MDGRKYAIPAVCSALVSAAATTIVGVISAATVRPRLYEIELSGAGNPSAFGVRLFLLRFTAAGTKTAIAPNPLDPADPAALAAGAGTYTGEPTYTANSNLLTLGLNSMGTKRWVTETNPFIAPATAANGLGLQIQAYSTAFALDATFAYAE